VPSTIGFMAFFFLGQKVCVYRFVVDVVVAVPNSWFRYMVGCR
jgi:hypothetical protein